jgi:hypothetical protein
MQSNVDRYLAACGCHEGKVGILVAILFFTSYQIVSPATSHLSGGPLAGTVFAIIVLGAIVGKVAGLLRARILLRRSIYSFKKSLQ